MFHHISLLEMGEEQEKSEQKEFATVWRCDWQLDLKERVEREDLKPAYVYTGLFFFWQSSLLGSQRRLIGFGSWDNRMSGRKVERKDLLDQLEMGSKKKMKPQQLLCY